MVIFIKLAVAAGCNALTVLSIRFTIAGIFWWLILLLQRQSLWPGKRLAIFAFLVCGFTTGLNAYIYYLSTARVPGALAALAVGGAPLLTALLSKLFLHESLGKTGLIALVISIIGGTMLASNGGVRTDPLGLLGLGLAVLLYSVYLILAVTLVKDLSPSVSATYIVTGAAVSSLICGATFGKLQFNFSPLGWISVLGMTLIPTVFGQLMLLAGVKVVGATRAAIIGTIEPVVGTMLSIVILGDYLQYQQYIGGGLVILATLLVLQDKHGFHHMTL